MQASSSWQSSLPKPLDLHPCFKEHQVLTYEYVSQNAVVAQTFFSELWTVAWVMIIPFGKVPGWTDITPLRGASCNPVYPSQPCSGKLPTLADRLSAPFETCFYTCRSWALEPLAPSIWLSIRPPDCVTRIAIPLEISHLQTCY